MPPIGVDEEGGKAVLVDGVAVNVMGGTVMLELDEVPPKGTVTSSLLIAFEEYSDRSVISETQEMRIIRQLSLTPV
jgi:hypothetical protein